MSAIFYMLRKEWKNRFLALFRHPGKLVVYILLVLLLVNSVVSVALTPQADLSGFVDLRILHGIYFGILLLITVPILLSALQKGTTFFGMSDVNLLFVSPISPKKILAYGLMKQMGRTLLMVFFFLFYGAMMAETFGIVWTDTLALVLGAAVALFSVQVLSLLLYNFTNGSPLPKVVPTPRRYWRRSPPQRWNIFLCSVGLRAHASRSLPGTLRKLGYFLS